MYSNVYEVCMSLMSIIYKSISFCLDVCMRYSYLYIYIDQYF